MIQSFNSANDKISSLLGTANHPIWQKFQTELLQGHLWIWCEFWFTVVFYTNVYLYIFNIYLSLFLFFCISLVPKVQTDFWNLPAGLVWSTVMCKKDRPLWVGLIWAFWKSAEFEIRDKFNSISYFIASPVVEAIILNWEPITSPGQV